MSKYGVKKANIRLLYNVFKDCKPLLWAICVAPFFFLVLYVHAQYLSEDAYVVETVHVFPSSISGEGWKNVQTLRFQNLDEYALLQDFNEINAATIDGSRATTLEEIQRAAEEQSEVSEQSDAANTFNVPAASSESVDGDADTDDNQNQETVGESATTTDSGVSPAADTTDDEDVVIEDNVSTSTNETTAEQSTVTEPDLDPVETETEAEIEDEAVTAPVATPTASTTVLRTVSSLFELAVSTVTSTFNGTSDETASTEQPEEAASDTETIANALTESVASTTPEDSAQGETVSVSTSSTTAPVNDVVEPSENAATSTDVVDATASSTEVLETATTTPEIPDNEPVEPVDSCADNACAPEDIIMSNFGFPLDPGVELSGAQLRLSFAALERASSDANPEFAIEYQTNRTNGWLSAGAIEIDDEVSNSINGGYFLFALPEISTEADLEALTVKLSYKDNGGAVKSLFVESAWLEIITVRAPEIDSNEHLAAALADDGYTDEKLSGDALQLPDGETVRFEFTDENSDETLIIKTDEKDYAGLTKTTTYVSVTNESDRADEFTLQTYFPDNVGEVTNLEAFVVNKPKEVVVPEYRPFIYHCADGWEYSGQMQAGSIEELSQQLVPRGEEDADAASTEAVATTTAESTPEVSETGASTTDTIVEPVTAPTTTEPVGSSTASTTVWRTIPSAQRLLQAATTTPADNASDVETVSSYTCRNTNVVRTCDAIEGDNTACRINNHKVAEHRLTKYVRGWEQASTTPGNMPKPGLLRRAAQFIGFGPDKKEVPESFEVRSHTPESYTIEPGETKYFKMEISFPPFSTGEYWIEAVGNREYGLLDPFWSSQWRYRKAIDVDNTGNASSTEQQVFLELTSAESDFWSNVNSDGSDIRFIQEEAQSLDWYDVNWNNRMPVTINASQVDDDLTDFVVYVDLADLGSDFFENVRSDGGDIRITTEDGMTELAREVVSVDTGAETGELYFRASTTISSTTDTTFYVYYDNGSATDYAASDPFGSENVWGSEFEAVYHLEEDAAGTGNSGLYEDATQNNRDADDNIDSTGKTGKLGRGQEIRARESATDDHMIFPSANVNTHGVVTMSYWLQSSQAGNQALMNGGAGNEYLIFLVNGGTTLQLFDGGGSVSEGLDSDLTNSPARWRHVMVSRDSDNNEWRIFADGVEDTNGAVGDTLSALSIPADCLLIGLEQDGSCLSSGDASQHLDGFIDEVRFQTVVPTAAEASAMFRNQATTSDFYATSSAESYQSVSFTELDFWVQHFDYTNQEADIWVQTDSLPANATSTLYLYYGNSAAVSASDPYAPFTYSTSTDLYYVVNPSQTSPIQVYSYIDDNEVRIDGGAPVALDSGESTTFSTYASTSVISALGPITARTVDDSSEPPVPISFATTTHIVTTNRNNEDFYVLPPFAAATIDIYEGANGAPTTGSTVTLGNSDTYNVNLGGSDFGIAEGTEPFLLYHNNDTDSYVAYPPTLRDLYGIYSNTYNYGVINGGASVEVYCSSGATGTTTGMTRGGEYTNDYCSGGGDGTGDAVRLTNQTEPMGATQQADGDGNESSRFLPAPEFATRYIVPTDAEYVTVACAPRFGSVDLEVQTSTGVPVDTATCSPSGEAPGAVNFTPASPYAQGYQVVATNDVPFYMYYEDDNNGDETNTWGAVQAKQFRSLDALTLTIGPEEENTEPQYEQFNYRWYQNNDALTPVDPWDLGEDGDIGEAEAISGQGAINPGDELRLRMSLLANNGTGTENSVNFKLQYAEAETCSTVLESNWYDLGDIGSTTAAFAGFGTPVTDGSTLPSVVLSDSDVPGTFEEENFSSALPNQVDNGEVVEFDWSITPVNGAVAVNTEYCFRMVRSTNVPVSTYTSYPEVLTAGPPEVPELLAPFNNEHVPSVTPDIEFAAVDLGGDQLDYQVQISTDNTFTSIDIDRRSDTNFLDFVSVTNPSDKTPFDNGSRIRFTPPSSLTSSSTYWWRVRAIDPDGSNTFGNWSSVRSFTVNESVTVSEWYQTTDEQFETNSLSSATTSGSDSIELDIGGSTLLGEYGSVSLTNGATTSVTLNNSYTNPVVVGSLRYSRSIASPNQPAARVFNKASGGFDVIADNFDGSSVGSSTFDYIVMEAGDYLMDDGSDGLRVYATSTSVSAIAGNTIPADPGGTDIVYPTSFGGQPSVFTMVTTLNDPQWVVSSVYDGNDVANPPSATQVSLYLNDNLDSNGHGSAEDIDVIVFDTGIGTNDSTLFDIFNTGAVVDDVPYTANFTQSFSSAPGVALSQTLTMNGTQGGYSQIDTDNPITSSDITVSLDEGGNGADRGHATEDVAVIAFGGSGGNILRAGNATVVSTPIDFDDATVGNAWGEVSWNDTGDITYQVEYQTGTGFQLVPDSALPGNSSGFGTSPINILDLDTSTYNQLRLVANFGGIDPELFDWTVRFGQRVDVPELGDPFDNQKIDTTTPTFDFTSSDPQGDDLEYEISISTDPTFVSGSTTVNSEDNPSDFDNADSPGDSAPFTSSETVEYTVPGGQALTDTTTYWWRVRAKDPAGSDSWSPWSEADNFTVDTSVSVSSWFQTTEAQFSQGVLDGLIASTSDSVEVSTEIGEYGTTTLTNNEWQTVETNLTYNNMVVVAKPSYVYDSGSDNSRVVQVRNKTDDSFEIKAENESLSLSGSTNIDYIVMEAGDWEILDGAAGTRVIAGTETDVTEVEGSNSTYVGGRSVSFSPTFGATPAAITTVSTANGSDWVGTNVDDGTASGEVTASGMAVSLHVSYDTDVTREPEDIDYVVFETGTGDNNGSLFDVLNSSDSVGGNSTAVSFNQSFTTAPGIILSQVNGIDGGDGGFSVEDETTAKTNTQANFVVTEMPLNGAHTAEIISVVAFENDEGTIVRSSALSGGLQGTIASEPVLFSDGTGPKFDRALFSATNPGNSSTSLQIQYQTATGSWALLPDTEVPGNSTGFTGGSVDLTGVDITTYPTIRLLATLTCDGSDCPTLEDWTVEWSEGVIMSGTLQQYDRSTNVNSGTVTVSVNGNTPTRTGTVTNGLWSISNVTAFSGDVLTVFVDGAAEAEEAVGVFVYDGLGDMTGVELYEQHLSFAADETATTSLSDLTVADSSAIGDEDVFFEVDVSGDLTVCGVGSCANANLYVGAGNTLRISTSTASALTTHDVINDGQVVLGDGVLRASGSWDNNATFDAGTGSVIMSATAGTETLNDVGGVIALNSITFGESSGTATWQLQSDLDLSGALRVDYGTLDRASYAINLAGLLATGANGFWSGAGTTTFDGTGTATWSDANAVSQDVGQVVVDGAPRTVTVGSDIAARSIVIGTNDTLNGGGTYDIAIAGDFTNNNTFVPATSRIVVVGTSTNATVSLNGDNLYALRASSTGGSVAFAGAVVTMLDNLEIAAGTVTLPTTRLNVGGSFVNTGGAFAHNNAEVVFTGGGSETIALQGTVFLNAFYDVRFTGSGIWNFTDVNATTTGQMLIENGDVTLPSGNLTVGRDFVTSGGGAFAANGGQVTFLTRSTDQITANGSAFNDVRIKAGTPLRGGAYPAQWLYRDMVTIDATYVDEDLTDYPVYLDLSDFDSNFFTEVAADGGDIRVTGSDGVTELPREIVAISTGAETGEMYFKAPSLSSTTNSTFYVYYGNATATDYALDATYGAENVWDDDFLAVYHMEELNPLDSTSFDRDATVSGNTPTLTTGRFGGGIDITDDGGSDYIDLNSNLVELNGGTEMTISAWANIDDDTNDDVLFVREQNSNTTPVLLWDNISGNDSNDTYTFLVGDTGDQGNRVDALPSGIAVGDTWQYVVGAMQGADRYIYVGGQLRNTDTTGDTTIPVNTEGSAIGYWGGSGAFDLDGTVDEYRISQIERSAAWIAAEYTNMASSSDFYSVSSGGASPERTFTDANVTATGDLVVESGDVQFPSNTFDVAGSFVNDGTFDAGSGAVRFNGSTGTHVIEPGTSTFYNLIVDGGADWTITENATATNALTLQNAGSFTVGSGVVTEAAGAFTNEINNASTTWTGSTLRLSGGGTRSVSSKTADGDDYATLEVVNNTTAKLWNSTASTYGTLDTSAIYSQDHAGVDGDLYIFGSYVRESGTEHWSYATDFDGVALDATSSRAANVRIANGASVTASSSVLSILGTSSASTTIDAQSGSYALTANTATVTASYATFAGGDANGLSLTSSTTVTTFDDLSFTIPGGSSAVTVDASTIDTNPAAQFFRTDFVSGGGSVNVTLSGSPASYWWFRDGAGDRYGEAFDNADGDPGAIRWDDSSYLVTVAGTVYADDGVTTLGGPTCDGATQNVRIVVDGGAYTDTTSCSGVDGSYSFSNVSYVGDPRLVVYLDTNGGENASVITKTPTADITDLDLYANRVVTRHEDVAPLTIADMVAYDEDDDSDLHFVAATGTPNTLTVRSDTELLVASSITFAPGGNLILQSGTSGNGYDGSLHLDNDATFVAAGTESHQIGGSFFNDLGSAFTAASSTFTFTATDAGRGITNANVSTLDFNELAFTGAGSWNISADLTVAGDMDVASGTVTGTGDITMTGGAITGTGLLSLGGGTVTLETSTTLGDTTGWTFNNLTLGDGSVTGTTTRSANATTTILGQLTIASGHFLDANASTWDLAGAGSVFVENGTFLEDTSTIVYSGGSGATVLPTTYYNLTIAALVGTPSFIFGGPGVLVNNDLNVAGGVPSTADLTSSDPVVTVNGDVVIGANGVLEASDTTDLTILGSYSNSGTFNGNGGEVVFASPDAYTINAGNSPFADVLLTGAGAGTVTANATSTGTFTLASTSDFTLQSGATLAVGGALRVETADTNWTGTTLSLFGGGTFEINPKTLSETFDAVVVTNGTQARSWNTTVGSVTTAAGGALYSQDHAGVDGDLYIYGDYTQTSLDDYWAYATDFDGADLSGGSERNANVYVSGGGSATWTGGSLTVAGTSSATTTIANQGSGTYDLTIGGSAATDWQYAAVRNIGANGVTFAGSPSVADFSDIDLLVESNGGTAMTVAGSAITASPARTFSRVAFNSDVGVTGASNVTATGATLSGWRFTAHYGNLDGEGDDVDPAGDPGYIIWDDSAAIISISGTVYEADGSTVSSACDDSTAVVMLAIDGSIAQNASSSCASSDGSYTISGVSFGSQDELMLYINGDAAKGVTVSKDPISSIADMDIYENHVIMRHENNDPLTIADMAAWDSSDDGDIQYTAVTGGTDTLTVAADTKVLVWNGKTFEPQGDMSISGGGGGAAYDGSFEALANASLVGASGESHDIGGSFEFDPAADFEANDAAFNFTSDAAGRQITVGTDAFASASFTGTGAWSITDAETTIQGDLSVSAGALTLSSGTTTIAGSLSNSATLNTNNGLLYFTAAAGSESVALGGAEANDVTFAGAANFALTDTNVTATGSVRVATGTVTFPSGTFTIGQDLVVSDTILHNNGTVVLDTNAGDSTLTLGGNDLNNLTQSGSAVVTLTDASASLLGDLLVNAGTFTSATNTLSVGGSFDVTNGVFNAASSTVLFNSGSTGETVAPGANTFYNLTFANPAGGWTLNGATTTNNFTLASANNFTLNSGASLYVGGVFLNSVGGAATTWTGTTVTLDGANAYTVGSKSVATESYENVVIGAKSDIRFWNSSAATLTVADTSSVYSQDHAGVDGALNIYGDFAIGTSTEYWSYARDFDGTALGGSSRAVTVSHGANATTTLSGTGGLEVVGAVGATTTVQSAVASSYDLIVTGGALNMNRYALNDMSGLGLQLSGSPTINSLSNGSYILSVDTGRLITLDVLALDSNPSLVIQNVEFDTTPPASSGNNVVLSASSTNSWSFRGDYGALAGEDYDVDGVTACGAIRFDDSSCLLTEQTEYRWRNDDGGIGVPDSEWLDTDWGKRARVRVANNDNALYSNVVVPFTVTYDADMQTDFGDLRFTAQDGTTELDFWVERFTSGVSAEVWIEVPTLLADGTAQIFMYYDNTTANSGSSATSTFAVVDDFEDGDISEYSGQTGLFSVDTNLAYGGLYGLELGAGNKGTRLDPGIARFDQLINQGETISFKQYVDTSAGSADEVCTMFGVQSPVSLNQNYAVCIEQFGTDRISLVRDAESTDTVGGVTRLASSSVSYTTGWYVVEVDWESSDDITVRLYNPSGSLVTTISANDSTYSSGGFGFTSWSQNGAWDSFTSRPIMATAPSIFFGAEQVRGGASYAAAQNTASTDYTVGDVARLRVAIENTGLDITDQQFALEFAPKDTAPSCAAVAAVDYSAVPTDASCGGSAICMATSTVVSNGVQTTDLLAVERNDFTTGAFVSDPSNKTNNIDVDQNFYTELEYALTVTPSASDESYCFRVTDAGTPYDSYLNVPELSLRFEPIVNTTTLNNGFPISLTPGTTTPVYATGTVTDLNGYTDLLYASSTIYRSGVTGGALCTTDNNDCYRADTSNSCSFTNCSGNTCTVSCRADIFFHADATDLGSDNEGEEWLAFIEVEDASEGYDFASAPGVELNTLRAIDVFGAIDYGALEVNSNTGSVNASTTIENLGNVEVDIDVQGTDLTDGLSSFIPAEQQKFATTTFNYSGCGSSCTLLSSSSAVVLDVDLTKPTNVTPPVADEVYWGIEIPFGVNSAPHQGFNVFTPISP